MAGWLGGGWLAGLLWVVFPLGSPLGSVGGLIVAGEALVKQEPKTVLKL